MVLHYAAHMWASDILITKYKLSSKRVFSVLASNLLETLGRLKMMFIVENNGRHKWALTAFKFVIQLELGFIHIKGVLF